MPAGILIMVSPSATFLLHTSVPLVAKMLTLVAAGLLSTMLSTPGVIVMPATDMFSTPEASSSYIS